MEKPFFWLEISLSLPCLCRLPAVHPGQKFPSRSLPFKMRLLGEVSGVRVVIKSHSQTGTWRPALWGKRVVGFASIRYRIWKAPTDIKMGHEPREERGGGDGGDSRVI